MHVFSPGQLKKVRKNLKERERESEREREEERGRDHGMRGKEILKKRESER